jgi:hypothetical protein
LTDEASLADEAQVLEAWESGTLRALIERSLSVLIGEPFAYIGRAADLVWVGFGAEVHAPNERHPGRRVATYALHVQCPLRVDIGGRAWLGSWDMYAQPESPEETPDDFDWHAPGSNLFDRRAAELNARLGQSPVTVTSLAADSAGGLTIEMTDRVRLQVFPESSFRIESWRFFLPSGPHFVVLSESS